MPGALRQTKNKLVKAVQNLLSSMRKLLPQVETAKKNVEMCQVNADAAQKMQALGRASAQEVLTAQKALQQANSSAQQAENGALQLKQNILMLLGFDADAPVSICGCAGSGCHPPCGDGSGSRYTGGSQRKL